MAFKQMREQHELENIDYQMQKYEQNLRRAAELRRKQLEDVSGGVMSRSNDKRSFVAE